MTKRRDDREAEGSALLMRRSPKDYRGFESPSLRIDILYLLLSLVGIEPTTSCVGNTNSKSTELQARNNFIKSVKTNTIRICLNYLAFYLINYIICFNNQPLKLYLKMVSLI